MGGGREDRTVGLGGPEQRFSAGRETNNGIVWQDTAACIGRSLPSRMDCGSCSDLLTVGFVQSVEEEGDKKGEKGSRNSGVSHRRATGGGYAAIISTTYKLGVAPPPSAAIAVL